MKPILINVLGDDPVVRLAARELARYLGAMTRGGVVVAKARRYEREEEGVWVGLGGAFEKAVPKVVRSSWGLKPPLQGTGFADDAIHVRGRARGRHVVVTGVNPRSVLFAAYRYLEALGCRWLRPGPTSGGGGERVPRVADPLGADVRITEQPTTRHRCICIEGATSLEHVRHMIDYGTKRGFNSFMMQFFVSYPFWERWYALDSNRAPRRTKFSYARATAINDQAKRFALQRGLVLHSVGHGWTCLPMDFKDPAQWFARGQTPPARGRKYLAMVNGQRTLSHGGKPLFTQLCYSNPQVQRLLVRSVIDYARTHPAESPLFFSFGDGGNNHCECPACQPHRPADLYVRMLNAIDRELTGQGLPHRIVFSAYVDTLWAPEHEKIQNPDRFIFVFAPITRSYLSTLADQRHGPPEEIGPYVRNRLKFPATPAGNLQMIEGWRRAFSGEQIIFEYHLWRTHHHDPGHMRIARVLHGDLRALPQLGMSGFVSAQVMRMAFPTALCMDVMGRTLWNPRTGFGTLVRNYFRDLFGADGPAVQRYLQQITGRMSQELLDPSDNHKPIPPGKRAAMLRKWDSVPKVVDAFAAQIAAGVRSKDSVTASAWRVLEHHAWYVKAYARLYGRIYRRDPIATPLYAAFARELAARLPELHPVLDTYMARMMTQHALAMEGLAFEEWATVKRK